MIISLRAGLEWIWGVVRKTVVVCTPVQLERSMPLGLTVAKYATHKLSIKGAESVIIY